MKYLKFLTAMLLLTPLSNANAIDFLIEAGLHTGGDKLINVPFTSGESESIYAGDLLSVSVGAVADHGSFEMRYKYGYKFDSITALNGSVDWERNTIDVLAMYKYNTNWRLGGGLTYHLNPEVSGTGVVSGSVKYDDSLGFMAEADYFWGNGNSGYFGLVFTAIDYDIGSVSISGNSIGINVGGIF